MKIKPFLHCTLAALAVLSVAHVSAQTYQWKDAQGRTVISDTPPPRSIRDTKTYGMGRELPPPPPTTPPSQANGNPNEMRDPRMTGLGNPPNASIADKEIELRKRMQANKEKAEKDEKDQQLAQQNRESCERAKRQLMTYESGERVMTRDSNGERAFLDDAQRKAEADRIRKQIQDNCK